MSVLDHFIMAAGIVAGLIAWIAVVFWAASRPDSRHPGPHPRDRAALGDRADEHDTMRRP